MAGQLDNWGDVALLFNPVQCTQTTNTTTLAIQQVCDYNWEASTNDVINQYIHSLYWAITLLTTTGYGDIHPISNIEKGYNIILYILGIMAYTLLVTYLQEIMSGWDITYGLFKQRMEIIYVVLYDELFNTTKHQQHLTKEYTNTTVSTTNTYDDINDDIDDDDIDDDNDNMNEINVIKNKSLVSDVKRYYDHLWIMQRGLMHYEIQEYMPNRLYSATLLHIFAKQMRSLFFIQQCSLEFQYAFLNKLKVHYYMQGDYIFHTGEVARSLYLLHTGDVTLISSEVNTEVRPTDSTPYYSDISTSSSSTRKYSGHSIKRVSRSTAIHKSNAIFPISSVKTKYINGTQRSNISKVSHKTISVKENGTSSSRSSLNKHRTSINRLSNRISRINKSIHRLSRFSYLKRHLSKLNHSKSTCYKTISEGSCIGTAEFFLKNVYTCTAKVATTTTTDTNSSSVGGKDIVCTFEIEYDEFYQLLVDFKLEHFYQQVLEQNETKLYKHSTLAIVSKLNLNLNQLRLKKLLSLRLPNIPVIECYSENNVFYQIWNTVMLIVITMVAIWIPYYMAFAKSYQVKWQLVIDILVIAIYWVDIYLRMFILSYLDGQISSIKEPSLVYKTYIRSSFLLDLISAIPFSLLVYVIFTNTFAYSIVRYIMLIRIYRLPQLIYSLLKTRTKQIIQFINEDLQRLLYIISVFVYTTHLTSCILCCMGRIEITSNYDHCSHSHNNNISTCNTSWIIVNGLSSATNSKVYLYAYYWTLYTLSSVGYGSLATHSNIEKIYLLCIMVIGTILYNIYIEYYSYYCIYNNILITNTGSLLCAMVSAIITSILEKNIQKKGDLR